MVTVLPINNKLSPEKARSQIKLFLSNKLNLVKKCGDKLKLWMFAIEVSITKQVCLGLLQSEPFEQSRMRYHGLDIESIFPSKMIFFPCFNFYLWNENENKMVEFRTFWKKMFLLKMVDCCFYRKSDNCMLCFKSANNLKDMNLKWLKPSCRGIIKIWE